MGSMPDDEVGTPDSWPVAGLPDLWPLPLPLPLYPSPTAGSIPLAGSDAELSEVQGVCTPADSGGSGPLPAGNAAGDEDADSPTLTDFTEALRGVERQAEAFHTRARAYENIIQQMESRIEQLQGDQILALLKPLLQRIAGLHAQAAEASDQARTRGESAAKDFEFFAVAIEEALGLIDIESVAAAPAAPFDPRRHAAGRVLHTDNPALDGLIHRVLRQGFTYAGAARVFLPAQVSVYRFKAPSAQEAVAQEAAGPVHEQDSDTGSGEGASLG